MTPSFDTRYSLECCVCVFFRGVVYDLFKTSNYFVVGLCFVSRQAAEALGAIGASRSESILKEFSQDPAPEVANTCQV